MLLLAGLLFSFRSTTPSTYLIKGHGKGIRNGDVLYLAYRTNDKLALDSTIAQDQQFTFRGTVSAPINATLYRNENPHFSDFVHESLAIYLEPGTININSRDTLTNAVIGGTLNNNTLQLLQNKLARIKQKNQQLKDPEFFTAAEKQDTALVNYTKRELLENFHERVRLELDFVKEHPKSFVSLEVLTRNSRINKFTEDIAAAYEMLAIDLKNTPQGNTISENIKRGRRVVTGMEAKDFTLPDKDGQQVRLSSLKGQYVLLDFWASWCLPCRQEHPNLIKAYEQYRAKGFTIVSVSLDKNKSDWLDAITQDQLVWPQVSDLKGSNGEVANLYGITSIPSNVLIDPKGVILQKDLRGNLLQETLATIFSR
jgi:peroxiredoxin